MVQVKFGLSIFEEELMGGQVMLSSWMGITVLSHAPHEELSSVPQATSWVWVINFPGKYSALVGNVYLETFSILGSG